MKKERQKMKLWEKILVIILFIVLIIYLIIAWRYYILIDIEKENNVNLSKTNCYYSLESNSTIIQSWKKDAITKINMKQKNGEEDITFWNDSNTGEGYIFYNVEKIYSENQGGILGTRPRSITTSYDNLEKFMLAINPTIFVGFKNYENKDCYYIKIGEQEELVEKGTGLLLNTKDDGNERKITYSFDTVTDKDVEKPDISQYTLPENNQM